MLPLGLFGHSGKEPARASGPPVVLGRGDDKPGLLEHEQMGPYRVRVLTELGGELVRRTGSLALPQVLEEPHATRVGERPVLDDFSIHSLKYLDPTGKPASEDSPTKDGDLPRCRSGQFLQYSTCK